MFDIKHQSELCSGGWPTLESYKITNGDDMVYASWYSGPGVVDPLPCIFLKRDAECIGLVKDESISMSRLSDQMRELYLQHLKAEGSVCLI